ncbi:hypothetical protein ACGFZL_31035 [Streptomyces sp. NPDC048182]|uniref:hypothetical protein n=1 Tax=Streptomyces sp. NPDC048182 TaxID=3365507 RepID=UPI0037122A83
MCDAETESTEQVVALDPANWTRLWAISEDDESRLMPSVSAVFHGAVYGETENGYAVLDARTGKDRGSGPGSPPFSVNEYAGLFRATLGTIEVHPAVG